MQSELYPRFFANSFGTLDHFKVDCTAEELAQGLHLVILMNDTGLEKDSPASSVPRVYYEPLTSSASEVRQTPLSLSLKTRHAEQCTNIIWNKYSTSKFGQERGMSPNQPIETQEQKKARAETFNMVSLSKAWALECRQ